jgi:hypothetical protein
MAKDPDRREPEINIDHPFSSEIKGARCPGCGKMLDGVTNLTGQDMPADGDFSVCMYCCTILRYTRDLNLEKAAVSDLRFLMTEQPKTYNWLLKIRDAARSCMVQRIKRN